FLTPLGIELISHTVAIEGVEVPRDVPPPPASELERIDADLMRCAHPVTSQAMVERIDAAHKAGDTLGGVIEVAVYGLPPGLGSYVQWDRRLDGRLAAALMGIQAMKGVEVGDGFHSTTVPGSLAHDEIVPGPDGASRVTGRSGGIEGGMSTGEVLRVRAGMKPISTVPKALRTIDTSSGEAAGAHHQRSDVCAVPAAGVVAEAMVALVIAQAVLEKCGGDSLGEVQRNLRSYVQSIPEALRTAPGSHGE
ncbi:MAG: chorismate synthase, partial [Pontimonas sp.]